MGHDSINDATALVRVPDAPPPTETLPGSTETFEKVLTDAQLGDSRAFEVLYGSLNRRLYAFAKARRADDPEGLVNDVFSQVFTNISGFTGGQVQFNAWVFTIARNKMIDEARRRAVRPVEVLNGFTHPEFHAAPDNVEQQVLDQLDAGSLLTHLDSLTPEQREVVLLRIVSDVSINTVAEIMDKNPTAVKALQRRALRAMARNMSDEAEPR